jgi:TRAP-type uncharacterized transport system fused permease subunit
VLGIVAAFAGAALAVAALAFATGGWLAGPAGPVARGLGLLAGLCLLYLHPVSAAIGAGLLAAAIAVHFATARRRRQRAAAAGGAGEATQ